MTERDKKPITLNLASIELAISPPIAELLRIGTAREVRQALDTIAFQLIRANAEAIPDDAQQELGNMLNQIARGTNPSKALGLTRKKKHGAWYAKNMQWLADDLARQGLTKEQALEALGRTDWKKIDSADESRMLDIEGASEKVRKRIARARTK